MSKPVTSEALMKKKINLQLKNAAYLQLYKKYVEKESALKMSFLSKMPVESVHADFEVEPVERIIPDSEKLKSETDDDIEDCSVEEKFLVCAEKLASLLKRTNEILK